MHIIELNLLTMYIKGVFFLSGGKAEAGLQHYFFLTVKFVIVIAISAVAKP